MLLLFQPTFYESMSKTLCVKPFNCRMKALHCKSFSKECQEQWQPDGKAKKIDTALQHVSFCQAAAHTHTNTLLRLPDSSGNRTIANESSITYTLKCSVNMIPETAKLSEIFLLLPKTPPPVRTCKVVLPQNFDKAFAEVGRSFLNKK